MGRTGLPAVIVWEGIVRLKYYLAASASALFAILGLPGSVRADAPKDVPQGHWAYSAVDDLASKGLIKGYPPEGGFFGKRTVTRYEMAVVIQRVLARVDDLVGAKADKGSAGTPAQGVTPEQLAEVRKLVDDFRAELTVIGTDMEKVKADIGDLKTEVGGLNDKVNGFDTRMGADEKRIGDVNLLADQGLKSISELKTATNAALAKKVDVNVGKLRLGGLFQIWYGNPFGNAPGGASNGAAAPGRNYGGGPGDTFRLRRGEIILKGSPVNRVDYTGIFNLPSTGTGSAAPLLDLFIGYQLTPRFRFEIGQQKTGLSEEGTRTSGQLLTVARSIMSEDLPKNAGRIGNAYDTGAVLRYKAGPVSAFVGAWNDNGATQSVVDSNRQKFIDAGLYVSPAHHLTLGLWGGTNIGDSKPAEGRDRAGFTTIWQSGPHLLEIEGAYARDYAAGAPGAGLGGSLANGGYALYAHSLSKSWQLFGRYDMWSPAVRPDGSTAAITLANGTTVDAFDNSLREYTFGVNYYLLGHNAKVMLNYIREDPGAGGVAFWGKPRSMLLSNFQVAF